jgi:hypothetical protein
MLGMTATASPPAEYFSVGELANTTQFSVPTIRRVLAEKGIHPAFYLNNIDHFDGMALLEMNAYKREQEKQ